MISVEQRVYYEPVQEDFGFVKGDDYESESQDWSVADGEEGTLDPESIESLRAGVACELSSE